jgi:2-hydroxy-3-keto-5-methylthiopentenyl-1-phosphate phosphatase
LAIVTVIIEPLGILSPGDVTLINAKVELTRQFKDILEVEAEHEPDCKVISGGKFIIKDPD